jgi:hypothetical protein
MPRQKRYADGGTVFDSPDPSSYMLGLPKSRPRLGPWGVVAILAGTVLALMVMMLENYQF